MHPNSFGYIEPDENAAATLAAVRFQVGAKYAAIREGLRALSVELQRVEKSATSYREKGCTHGRTLDTCDCLGDCYVRAAHLKVEISRMELLLESLLPGTHPNFMHQV